MFSEIICDFNNGKIDFKNFVSNIVKLSDFECNSQPLSWFIKDILKNNNINDIYVNQDENGVYHFCSNNNLLFSISKNEFDEFNTDSSLLRTTLYPSTLYDGSVTRIYNDRFILGQNGLYSIIDDNNYRYVTFNNDGTLYYESFVNKSSRTIKKSFYDKNGEVSSQYFYRYSLFSENDRNSKSKAINRITEFLEKEFPNLRGNEYSREFYDLCDQYFYDIRLTDKKERYSDIYLSNGSSVMLDDKKDFTMFGISIKGIDNRNFENFTTMINPSNSDLKMMLVTDFVNGSKVDKSLSEYVTLSLRRWFYNLDGSTLTNDRLALLSLENEIQKMSSYILDETKKIRKKKKIKLKTLGSALGLCFITKDNTYIINYGDTRIYALKGDNICPVTVDDTMVWDMYKNNTITKDEAFLNQRGSILTNYLGINTLENATSNIISIPNNSYDGLYIFSDGITDNLSDSTINNILMVNTPSSFLRETSTMAYKNQDRHDDITGCCYIKK